MTLIAGGLVLWPNESKLVAARGKFNRVHMMAWLPLVLSCCRGLAAERSRRPAKENKLVETFKAR
jgi:hypothetical protein